jgi:TRAP-type uncharacterized transport system substrate-binding protein|tara:strand:- start:60 stop:704 length:645 start_codon:yes stop_codon:yes gene_type:complete
MLDIFLITVKNNTRMFFNKSNSIFKFFIILILMLFLNINNLFSLTQDINLNIASSSPLEIKYVLAKGICKMLSREHDVSKFMGGVNSLNCNVLITSGTKENLELIKLKKSNYAIIEIDKTPYVSNTNLLTSMIFFKGNRTNWALVTNLQSERQEVCEVTEAVFKNFLELKYLHSNFKEFSHETFIIRKIPIHMGALKYFETRGCKFKNNKNGEL